MEPEQPRPTDDVGPLGRLWTGVRWYVGIPRAGKTKLCRAHLAKLCAKTGWPALVLSMENDAAWFTSDFRRAESVAEALDLVFGQGLHAVYVPQEATKHEEVEAIALACLRPGHVNLVVDGAHACLTARRAKDGALVAIMRQHRHARANLLLTTHHPSGDIPQEAWSCAPHVYLFRCTGPAALRVLGEHFKLDVERIEALQADEFVELYQGF